MGRQAPRLLLLAGMLIAGCGTPAVTAPPSAPTGAAAAIPVEPSLPATNTVINTAMPVTPPTALPTAGPPAAAPNGAAVNCRSGADLSSSVTVILLPGQTAEIIGKTVDTQWLQVKNPRLEGNICWVAASVVTTTGDTGTVPVVPGLPAPTLPPTVAAAYVTDVSVSVFPRKLSIPGCSGPIQELTATATIEVSGPMTLQWHFETDQNGVLPSHNANFNKAGAKAVSQSFMPALDAGQWRVELFIDGISLKGTTPVAYYRIVCP